MTERESEFYEVTGLKVGEVEVLFSDNYSHAIWLDGDDEYNYEYNDGEWEYDMIMTKKRKLEGNTATMPLTNCFSISITVDDGGDIVSYQFNGGSKLSPVCESEIEYLEDEQDWEVKAAFRTKEGAVYFIDEFIRDNY